MNLQPPSLYLLGAPVLRVGQRQVPFTTERPFLLLALLACRRAWVRRDELADLLYPGRDLPMARSNLRKVLHLARQLEGAEGLEQQGDLLRWAPDSDLARFEDACSAHRHEEAVAAYGGPLLLGLDSAWPGEAAEWLHAERQRLHARWQEACTRRLAQLADDPAAASELAQTLLRADPLDDIALQALGRAQLALGRPAKALSQLRGYEQRLSDAIGLQPSAAVRALGDALEGKATAPVLAVADHALVGRRQELAQISQRLAEPDCHVLTLLGAPGSGKSTLARAVHAARAASALWVPLEDLSAADAVPGRVAALLQMTLAANEAPWAALARAMGTTERLLVLDNAEHLALASGLALLLAQCPGLRLLVTSRMPVGVAGEWRLPIAGLPLPDPDETDPEVLRANDAVRLFERRARPLAPGFDLAAEAADVVRLLHEVDGLPLAIELLAAWRRLMPVSEILAELAESLDLLEPATPNERSVRASFAKAWTQLGPFEQRVLAQMAVLPGPLSRAQVRAVLQAPLPVVAALADRSLVRAEDDGLFTLHPLIRRCAAPLAEDVDALRERHARELAQRMESRQSGAIEAAHLAAAWQWASEHADAAVLYALAAPWRWAVRHRADYEERWQQIDTARRRLLDTADAGDGADGVLQRRRAAAGVRLLLMQGQLSFALGLHARVLAETARVRTEARALGDLRCEVSAMATQSNVHWQRGRWSDALACLDEALELERRAGLATPSTAVRADRALILKTLGRYGEARAELEALVAARRQQGELRQALYMVINLGDLLRLQGQHQAALALLHEGLTLSRTPGDPTDEPFLLHHIGRVHEDGGRIDEALRWAEQAVERARISGDPDIEVGALLLRARVTALRPGSAAPAATDLALALAVARRVGSEPWLLDCVASAGVVLSRSARREAGLALVRWAQRQALFTRSNREDAERHIATLKIDPAEETAALRLLPPETPLAEVLAQLPV